MRPGFERRSWTFSCEDSTAPKFINGDHSDDSVKAYRRHANFLVVRGRDGYARSDKRTAKVLKGEPHLDRSRQAKQVDCGESRRPLIRCFMCTVLVFMSTRVANHHANLEECFKNGAASPVPRRSTCVWYGIPAQHMCANNTRQHTQQHTPAHKEFSLTVVCKRSKA